MVSWVWLTSNVVEFVKVQETVSVSVNVLPHFFYTVQGHVQVAWFDYLQQNDLECRRFDAEILKIAVVWILKNAMMYFQLISLWNEIPQSYEFDVFSHLNDSRETIKSVALFFGNEINFDLKSNEWTYSYCMPTAVELDTWGMLQYVFKTFR